MFQAHRMSRATNIQKNFLFQLFQWDVLAKYVLAKYISVM